MYKTDADLLLAFIYEVHAYTVDALIWILLHLNFQQTALTAGAVEQLFLRLTNQPASTAGLHNSESIERPNWLT